MNNKDWEVLAKKTVYKDGTVVYSTQYIEGDRVYPWCVVTKEEDIQDFELIFRKQKPNAFT